jgi:hypothetical protein
MSETILFCLVFLSQVLLISWLYPRRVIYRGRYVLENFPPSTHPKAYPRPIEVYERWLRNIARLNNTIVVVGLLIIALILASLAGGWYRWIFASSRMKEWVPFIVAPFFVVQMIAAVMYINFSGSKLMLAMKTMPPPRVRTAELHRRSLFDFVSPAMVTLTVLTNIAFIAFVLYSYRHGGLPLSMAAAGIGSDVLTLLGSFMVVSMSLRAPKVDLYQAHQDRHKALKLVVQQEFAYCTAFPVLFTALIFTAESLGVAVTTSLFMQGIAIASLWHSYTFRVEAMDFDVYRADAKGPVPDASARLTSP